MAQTGREATVETLLRHISATDDKITITVGRASIEMTKYGKITITGGDVEIKSSGHIEAKSSGNLLLRGRKISDN